MTERAEPADTQPEGELLADVQRELARLNRQLGAAEVSVDVLFLAYLLKTSRFGFFTFGPVTLDVRLIEDLVVRTAIRAPGAVEAPVYGDDCVRFFRRLTDEVRRSGRQRVDELHFLLAFMRTPEGLPGRVFGELGLTPEAVEAYAKQAARPGSALEPLFSPEEVAEHLGVHVQTVRSWIRSGRLPASRLAGQRALRIRASDIQQVLERVQPGDAE